MIRIENVRKVFQDNPKEEAKVIIKGVSLEVEKGDILGIIGHSGAGKSTLLRMINGLEPPTDGSVIVNGEVISQWKENELQGVRQKIGMIFQHFHLLWSRTVWENVSFPLEIAKKTKRERDEQVYILLEKVGLLHRKDAYPAHLSGGEKQRVGIARALANRPDVLLLDEATSALDPETTLSILGLLKEIHREWNLTMVVVTHEMNVVSNICNRVAVLKDGEIVEKGSVREVFNQPQHDVTQQFLQEFKKRG